MAAGGPISRQCCVINKEHIRERERERQISFSLLASLVNAHSGHDLLVIPITFMLPGSEFQHFQILTLHYRNRLMLLPIAVRGITEVCLQCSCLKGWKCFILCYQHGWIYTISAQLHICFYSMQQKPLWGLVGDLNIMKYAHDMSFIHVWTLSWCLVNFEFSLKFIWFCKRNVKSKINCISFNIAF